jgi:citrate synthase
MTTGTTQGLEGVVAAATHLSRVDGAAGRLTIAGYDVEDLAPHAIFEQVAYLLWYGRLPDVQELEVLTADLSARRRPPAATLGLLREAARHAIPVMDALRMAASTLSLDRRESPEDDARTLVATFPAIVGAYWRLRNGQEPIEPKVRSSHAEHCLHQIFEAATSGPSAPAGSKRISTPSAITASTRRRSPLASLSQLRPIWFPPLQVRSAP